MAPGTVPATAARTARGAARPTHLAARRRGYSGGRGGTVGMSSAPDMDLGALEQRLFELAADPLVVTCTDGRVLRVNRAACVLSGRDEAELRGMSWWDLLHPADHGAIAARHEEVRRDGAGATPFRCRIVRPDGGWRWVESSSTYDAEHKLLYSVVRDITGREDLELERLTTLFDAAPLGMAVMGPDGRPRRVNRPLAELLGRTEKELVDQPILDLVDDDDSRGTLALALGARPRPAFQFETRLRRADGHALIVLFSATLVTNARHEPVHYLCQILDITERAEAQERLELNEAKLAEAQQIARLGSWEW